MRIMASNIKLQKFRRGVNLTKLYIEMNYDSDSERILKIGSIHESYSTNKRVSFFPDSQCMFLN